MKSFFYPWLSINSDAAWEAHEEEERANYLFRGNLRCLISSPSSLMKERQSQQHKLWRWVGLRGTEIILQFCTLRDNGEVANRKITQIKWASLSLFSFLFFFPLLCFCLFSFLCCQNHICFCILGMWSASGVSGGNLHHRKFEERREGDWGLLSGELRCDEVFPKNAKLQRLNELTYQASEESNLMQLLRALHICRLHKQVIHTL